MEVDPALEVLVGVVPACQVLVEAVAARQVLVVEVVPLLIGFSQDGESDRRGLGLCITVLVKGWIDGALSTTSAESTIIRA